jgi:hypothetical protein
MKKIHGEKSPHENVMMWLSLLSGLEEKHGKEGLYQN